MRILIIEDDEKTADALATGLAQAGFSTATARTGEDGFFLVNTEVFDWCSSIGCCRGAVESRFWYPPGAWHQNARAFVDSPGRCR